MADSDAGAQQPNVAIHYRPAEASSGTDPESHFGYCHTHGLEDAYGHPELILRAFSASKSQALVDAIVQRVLSKGEKLEEDTAYEGFLSVPVKFKSVEVEGKKCMEMLVSGAGKEEWVEADVAGQEIGKLGGLDDLLQIAEGGISSGVVAAHWGCVSPTEGPH